jgi:hypothetical protein
MPLDNKTPKPTLEQLLRFKRSEKPEAAFWDTFEQELRRKQLAALVEKQPWYSRWTRFSLLTARKFSPVAAAIAAVLTVGYFSLTPAITLTKDLQTPSSAASTEDFAQIEQLPVLKVAAISKAKLETPPSFRAEARYVTNIMSKTTVRGQRFQTISKPQAFLANFSNDREYMAKTFSTQPVLGDSFQKKAITQF